MKTVFKMLTCSALAAGWILAGGIDGKWVAEQKRTTPNGEERVIKTTMDLKSDGEKLTGTVTMSMGMGGEGRSVEIREGKIAGNKFSFVTVMETPRGEFKSLYEGTVEGDTLKGTSKREGGQGGGREMPFEAKRAQ